MCCVKWCRVIEMYTFSPHTTYNRIESTVCWVRNNIITYTIEHTIPIRVVRMARRTTERVFI